MAATNITTIDKAVLKEPLRSSYGTGVVLMVVELPGGGIATTEMLVTWTALTADVGAPAFVRAVLKTAAKSVLNVVGSLDADSTLAVTAAAFDGGA